MRFKTRAIVAIAFALIVPSSSGGAGTGPVLHEPIPMDPKDDLALSISVSGELPAAMQTNGSMVSAPNPNQAPSPSENAYSTPAADRESGRFRPDRDTRKPNVPGYDDPFTPSTAPFKRLESFDAVSTTYELFVADKKLVPLSIQGEAANPNEDAFFADIVVDLSSAHRLRIPSVAPGARIVRARLGIGPKDIPFRIFRDSADNWFLEANATGRARLVMQVAALRASFAADYADRSWSQLPRTAAVPENVARSAAKVADKIGVSRALSPRDAVQKLVSYFRSFTDSNVMPQGEGDVYLDLALSKKGVCRHRAFAFTVTALTLGIPTRLVTNEAHAWVEVHDGVTWHRIDLGGAGFMPQASRDLAERVVHRPPVDAFAWPNGAEAADEMMARARSQSRSDSGSASGGGATGSGSGGATGSGAGSGAREASRETENSEGDSAASQAVETPTDREGRPTPVLHLEVMTTDALRGMGARFVGTARAEGEGCVNLPVEIVLRDPAKPSRKFLVGATATNEKGEFDATIVLPTTIPLGDYDVIARTPGDARCGKGSSP